ncbi:hypothetical protein PENSTE_c020G08481 [Penicillium steckii]|uniref:Uncharacterized protein n=1 Tax=Penicillium steckii TaxID=303698 RepID=A0A1V6SV17_9EURO|nr:hypothetical protein PENSTE_c020G08481 [Penicillium steckii]
MGSSTIGLQGCSLVTPDLSSIVRDNDILQPSKEQEDLAVAKSRAYWYSIASLAHTYLDHGLAPEFTSPQLALHKVPKFRSQLKSQCVRILGRTPISALCSEASSTWKLVEDSDCDALEKEVTKPAWVQVGTACTIPYSFRGEPFNHWIGIKTEKDPGPNYLGILTIGWCFILSAQLIEMQGGTAVMRYTNSFANFSEKNPSSPSEEAHNIDLGEVDERVARWWSAILAKREGWKAIVKNDFQTEFIAPWSGSRTCETSFTTKRKIEISFEQKPLSSDEAFYALLNFALLHNLGSQFLIALTTAMSFPMHRYYGMDVKLPLPRAHGAIVPVDILDTSSWKQVKQELPYYMTLSCSPEVMISTLCGSFWQPDIPCNMVSQWLHPVLEEVLDDVKETRCQELVAMIGAICRPTMGAFWIGAAVSGIIPSLLRSVRKAKSPLDSNAFPWTGAPQSFMDSAGSGPYTWDHSKYISRPDVWRLLHFSPTEEDDLSYEYGPPTPWEPCGVCLTTDCALRVTSHLKCRRHEYRYDHWNWKLENSEIVEDYGFSDEYPSLSTVVSLEAPYTKVTRLSFEEKELDPEREASEEASLDVFRWFIVGGEGLPPERIYHDDLLHEMCEQLKDDDYDDGPVEDEHRDLEEHVLKDKDRFEAWLDTIA